MPEPDPRIEPLRLALVTEARRRFGPQRAEALAPDLQALAADMAGVAEASLPPEVEPAFFLLGE